MKQMIQNRLFSRMFRLAASGAGGGFEPIELALFYCARNLFFPYLAKPSFIRLGHGINLPQNVCVHLA